MYRGYGTGWSGWFAILITSIYLQYAEFLAIPIHSIRALTSSIDWMAGVGRMMIGENGSDVSVSGYDGWIEKEIGMDK